MREILFRGKRNGYADQRDRDWLEGSLLVGDNGEYEICYGTPRVRIIYSVIPQTVGQFTGLLDKNGKRIFEGDILKPFDDEIDKMVVEFHHGAFVLCLYGERGYMGEGGWVEEGNYGVFECEPLSSYGDDVEVIGNIHDNPELLEAQS